MSSLPLGSGPGLALDLRAWLLVAPVALAAGIASVNQPLLVLAIAGGIAATAVFYTHTAFAVSAVLILRPVLESTAGYVSFGGAGNLAGLLGIAVVAGGGGALVLTRTRLRGWVFLAPACAFLGLAALSATWSFEPLEGLRAWVRIAAPVVLFALCAAIVTSARDLDRLVTVVLLSAVVPLIVGVVQFATGTNLMPKDGVLAVPSVFEHPNGYAFFLLSVLVVALVPLMESRSREQRAVYGVGFALGLASLVLCYGRSAWLAFALAVMVLGVLQYRRILVAAALVALLVPLALPSTASTLVSRFDDLRPSSAAYGDNSLNWRFATWERMWDASSGHTLLGNGMATYLPLSDREFGVYDLAFQSDIDAAPGTGYVYPHNDYLFVFIELGLAGALAYLAMFLALLVVLWRARRVPEARPLAMALFALVLVLTVLSAVDNVKEYNQIWYPILALAGGVAGLTSRVRAGRRPEPAG